MKVRTGINRDLNVNFDNLLKGLFNEDFSKTASHVSKALTSPRVNIKESEEAFDLFLAAPGWEKKDFEVSIDQDVLTISAEKKVEEKAETEKFTRKEFTVASFKRSFTLPDTTENANISASYKNGILSLSIPKKEEAKPAPKKVIKIA